MKPLSFQRGFIANLLGFMMGKSLQIISSAKTSNSASSTSLIINKPTGTQQGDLMIAFMCLNGGGAPNWTGDTGWTEVIDQATNTGIRVAYLVAGASEGSSYTFTSSVTKTLSGIIVTLRAGTYDTIGTIDTSASPVAPSISATSSGSMLLAFYASTAASITFTTPTGMSPVDNDADATAPSWALFSQTLNAAGATGTRTSTPSTSGTQGGLLLSVKPS